MKRPHLEFIMFPRASHFAYTTVFALLIAILISSSSLAKDLDWSFEDRNGEQIAVATIDKAYGPATMMMVREFVGNIELVAGESDRATLEFVLGGIKDADISDLEKWTKQVDINVKTGKKQWKIVGDHSLIRWNHRPWYLDLTISIPNGSKVDAISLLGGLSAHDYDGIIRFQTKTGGIFIDSCTGEFTLLTTTGGMELLDVEGAIDACTVTGGVIIENLTATERSRVDTRTGGVTIEETYGDLEVKVSTGGLKIRGHHDNLLAQTSTGGIDVRNLSGKLEASTSTGSVNLRQMGEGELFGLDLSTGTGQIEVQLDQLLAATIDITIDDYDGEHEFHSDFPIDKERERGDRYTAQIVRHGGGVPISLTTEDGWIHIEEAFK